MKSLAKKMNKKLLGVVSSIFALGLVAGVVGAQAAELIVPDDSKGEENVQVSEVIKNPYAFGVSVDIDANVDGDAVAAGQIVKVDNEQISGTLNMAGQNLRLETGNVEGSARLFGQTVEVSGSFDSDLMVFGQSVEIKDAQVNGELIVFAETLNLDNTTVEGKFKFGLSNIPDGNVDKLGEGNVFNGEVIEIKDDFVNMDIEGDRGDFKWAGVGLKLLFVDLAILIGTIILYFMLNRRGKLINKDIKFGVNAGFDIMVGAGLILLSVPAAFIISALGGIFALFAFSTLSIIFSLAILSSIFSSIYAANLMRSVGIGGPMWLLVAVCFVLFTLAYTFILPGIIGFPLFLVMFAVSLAQFGHVVRALIHKVW